MPSKKTPTGSAAAAKKPVPAATATSSPTDLTTALTTSFSSRVGSVEARVNTLQAQLSVTKSIACNADAKIARLRVEVASASKKSGADPAIVGRLEARLVAGETEKKALVQRMEQLETGSLKVATHVGRSSVELEGMITKLREMEGTLSRVSSLQGRMAKQMHEMEKEEDKRKDGVQKEELDEVRKDLKAMRIRLEAQILRQAEKQDALEDRLAALERVQDKQVQAKESLSSFAPTSHLPTRYDMTRRAAGTGANDIPVRPKKRNPKVPDPEDDQRRQERLSHLEVLMSRISSQRAKQAALAVEETARIVPSAAANTARQESMAVKEEQADLDEEVETAVVDGLEATGRADLPVETSSAPTSAAHPKHSPQPFVADRWRFDPALSQGTAVMSSPHQLSLSPSEAALSIQHSPSTLSAALRAQRALQAGASQIFDPRQIAPSGYHSGTTRSPSYASSQSDTVSLGVRIGGRAVEESAYPLTPPTPMVGVPPTKVPSDGLVVRYHASDLEDKAPTGSSTSLCAHRLAEITAQHDPLDNLQYRNPPSPIQSDSGSSSTSSFRSLIRHARLSSAIEHGRKVSSRNEMSGSGCAGEVEEEVVERGRSLQDKGASYDAQPAPFIDRASARSDSAAGRHPFLDSLPSILAGSVPSQQPPRIPQVPAFDRSLHLSDVALTMYDDAIRPRDGADLVGPGSDIALGGSAHNLHRPQDATNNDWMHGPWIAEFYSTPSAVWASSSFADFH